jgi:hypothetical protein
MVRKIFDEGKGEWRKNPTLAHGKHLRRKVGSEEVVVVDPDEVLVEAQHLGEAVGEGPVRREEGV